MSFQEREKNGVKKTMFTIFFTDRKLLITEYLPKGQKYSQDYFISYILPELEHEKKRYKGKKQAGAFCVKMDHSKSHSGGKIQEKIDRKGLVRCSHLPYSPDLSPCDFWFFGMAKEK
jgi:histone-lysine N-methyltransferase SETMAR